MSTSTSTGTGTGSVVLLDEAGTAIGTADKVAVHHRDTPLHLAFSVYVFDGDRLLLTQRALDKPTWPGAWTNSCCGHPTPGEPHADAVHRRVREEIGLELSGLTLLLPGFRYRATMASGIVENEMCPVYAASAVGDLRPDPAEVAATEWVDWAGFRADVLAGRREISPWCVEQVAALPVVPLDADAADPSGLPPAARRP